MFYKMKKIKHKNNNCRKGFTLVELLLCVAILAVVGLNLAMFISSSSSLYSRIGAKAEMQNDAQNLLIKIGNTVRNSMEVSVVHSAEYTDITSVNGDGEIIRIYFDAPSGVLYANFNCSSKTEDIVNDDCFLADNITELTVERTNINTIVQVEGANNITFESVEPFDSNRSLKLFIKLDKNNRSYSQTSYISVRNTNITIDYNYDDGTEEEA